MEKAFVFVNRSPLVIISNDSEQLFKYMNLRSAYIECICLSVYMIYLDYHLNFPLTFGYAVPGLQDLLVIREKDNQIKW